MWRCEGVSGVEGGMSAEDRQNNGIVTALKVSRCEGVMGCEGEEVRMWDVRGWKQSGR